MSYVYCELVSDTNTVLNYRQGVTTIPNYEGNIYAGQSFSVKIPTTYDKNLERAYLDKSATPTFSDPSIWEKQGDGTWQLVWPAETVASVTASSGSLDITFKNYNNNIISFFEAIPGYLNTQTCANGDYADISVPVIYENLKKYSYANTIFGNIRDTLSAFFPSIALEQRIVETTALLNEELVSGKITLEQFEKLIKESYQKIASQYGSDYEKNYLKSSIAIEKYKYLLK